jgi:hypothetical protein
MKPTRRRVEDARVISVSGGRLVGRVVEAIVAGNAIA